MDRPLIIPENRPWEINMKDVADTGSKGVYIEMRNTLRQYSIAYSETFGHTYTLTYHSPNR